VGFNKAQRMVQIVDLMARRGGVRASDLMDRFELDPRTLRRYLSDLRDLDVPIVDDGRGDDRVVSVDPRWRRTGVQLSLTEVLSLHFGRTLFNFLEGTSFASDMQDAIERLEPAISRSHADLARQLDTRFMAVPEHVKDYRDSSDVIDEIISSMVYNHPVDARYQRPRGAPQHYRLHPYTLAVFRQGLYLFAFDVDAQQVKTFAVERFAELVRRRTERFEVPPTWNPRAHTATAFGIIPGPTDEVVLAFAEDIGAFVRERVWHPTQHRRTLPDGRLELRMRCALTVELETWIRGFGPEVEVLAPPALVDRVAASLRAAAAKYAEPK
jgi:predicted DNA-binding transcriptional regulator YafY